MVEAAVCGGRVLAPVTYAPSSFLVFAIADMLARSWQTSMDMAEAELLRLTGSRPSGLVGRGVLSGRAAAGQRRRVWLAAAGPLTE
jgi:hypothetical protein